ncbi:MAG: non-homologous end-joining DNA ligase [Actinomycetota bacterium]
MATAQRIKVGRRSIGISNPDKLMFPDDGITKKDLIDYYEQIADVMLPEIRGRLLTMERFPNGIDDKRFFQKDMSDYFPSWMDRMTVPKHGGGQVTHVIANDRAALVYLANQACITLHMGLSRKDRIEYPDQMTLDLDPSITDFDEVRRTALDLKDVLDDLGLYSVVKTSGSRGLHVTSPLDRKEDFTTVRGFSRTLASFMAEQYPDRLTVEGRKDKRRDRIFVDWMRNANGQTAVAPFAVRALPGAPIAMPLSWEEVADPGLSPQDYRMKQVMRETPANKDSWKGWRRRARSLKDPARRLERLMSG